MNSPTSFWPLKSYFPRTLSWTFQKAYRVKAFRPMALAIFIRAGQYSRGVRGLHFPGDDLERLAVQNEMPVANDKGMRRDGRRPVAGRKEASAGTRRPVHARSAIPVFVGAADIARVADFRYGEICPRWPTAW